jgi:hypothetical protein
MEVAMDWQFADAKNRLSEVVTKALKNNPQRIRRRDGAVIIVDEKEYQRLKGKRRTFKDFLLNGPDMSGLDLTRDKSPMRDVEL